VVVRAARVIVAAWLGAGVAAGCTRPGSGSSLATTVAESGAPAEATVSSVPSATTSVPAGDDPLLVRERATLTLDGVSETWRLVWARPPFPTCRGAEARTCPCAGFAPGERGDLDLVRERPGAPVDRLQLSPLFEDHETILAARADADAGAHVLAFADYDHDGKASEMVFQVGAGPCGHTAWALLGVSSANPKLHAFVSAEDPKTPLVLEQRRDWETLRTKGSLERVQVACGDHGADESTSVSVTAAGGVLHAVTRTAACPP
jgi:hypothetical protein